MPSRAEPLLRGIALAALAAWIALALVPRATGSIGHPVSGLTEELPRMTRQRAPTGVHVQVDSMPDDATLAWLAALRRAGTPVTWGGDVPPMAFEAFRSSAPRADVVVFATGGDSVILGDALGVLDTLGEGASVRLASAEGDLTLRARTAVGRAAIPPRIEETKAVYVAGPAGWEAKFVIAALEEAGWAVDARLSVAPGKDVVQGRGGALDTARHAAAILLDSSAAERARGVEGFVRSGGGVVLAGSASRSRRVTPLIAWRAGNREVAALGTLAGDTAWRGLSRVPMTLVAGGEAVTMERRESGATMLARRHYAGRVAAVGYDETWRWRMAGGANSVAEHRAWWSRIVAGVAARPSSADAVMGAAPLARLHDVLGPPSVSVGGIKRHFPRELLANLVGALALAALLAEWMLRRARGAR
jgi:hypothetical protein